MAKEEEKKKNLKALGYSLLVYVGVIGVCLLWSFSTPPPLPNQDMGMVINLGNSPEGTGDVQPLNANSFSAQQSSQNMDQASPASNETGSRTESMLTDNSDEAPAIKNVPEESSEKDFAKSIEQETERVQKEPRPDAPVEPKPAPPKPKAVYSGGTTDQSASGNNAGANNASEGEGLTGSPGDQGAFNGDPTATNHNGAFSGLGGNSLSYRLGGRRIIQYPSRTGRFSEAGKVTLRIKVDRSGKVVEYNVVSSDNPTISNLAKQKVTEIRFNSSSSAPVVQFGEITFVFKLRQ